ncbi:MAG: outer membrane lipoprotein carrier protein LolA [Pseudomonadota bacterium]
MTQITRRQSLALLGAAAGTGLAGPALAQQPQVLTEVSKYLNQLVTIQGRFTQVNSDGSRISGQYYLARPGRIRFEYDGGNALVLASGVNVAVFDRKGNPKVQRYPLNQTPLRFLLAEQIDLTQRNLARDTGSQDGFTSVVLQDPRAPREGSMTLVLRNAPPTLTQWTVTDAGGQNTTVILESIERPSNMSARLFNIEAEARRWEG